MSTSTMELPGFRSKLHARNDLNYHKAEKFPIAVMNEGYQYRAPTLPVREYTIMSLVNSITDKPDWHRKIFDDSIVKKWKAEALTQSSMKDILKAQADAYVPPPSSHPTDHSEESSPTGSPWSVPGGKPEVSQKMVDWAIAEVKHKAGLFPDIDCVEALDGVWKSDTIVGEELRVALNDAVKPLEDVPEWIGKGDTLGKPDEPADGLGPEWSVKFQWLPTEFEALPGTQEVIAKSYINNLHPTYHTVELYTIISRVVAKAIPLWDRVLSHVICPAIPPRVSDWSNSDMGYADDEDDQPSQGEDEHDYEYDDRVEAWREAREIIEPEPGKFRSAAERIQELGDRSRFVRSVDLRKDYGRLQIIVKLANIHLTPEKPVYPGGSWHVEGQANESIDNITDSYLSFRQQVDDGADLPYPQSEHKAVEQIFGFDNHGPTIQNLGEVLTRESRLLCFPNVMQHRVSPFRLADPSKSGYRKILALFLVDPHLRIISTANVPPQQHSWWRKKVQEAGVHDKLPPELVEKVVSDTEFPVSLQKAREQRKELMEERKDFVNKHNKDFVNRSAFNVTFPD
ncbi:MAG: hypothetical protein Q9168_002766 [Polycauliona sp. 1 TL-2023]